MTTFDNDTQTVVVQMEGYMNSILHAAGCNPLSQTGATWFPQLVAEITEFQAKLSAIGIDVSTVS